MSREKNVSGHDKTDLKEKKNKLETVDIFFPIDIQCYYTVQYSSNSARKEPLKQEIPKKYINQKIISV